MSKTVVPYRETNLSKKEQVQVMFDRIAFRYDLMNRLLSFGIDVSWRKKMVRVLKKSAPLNILDVATGTADVAIQLTELHPDKITGIDISREMIALGRKKIEHLHLEKTISLQQADSEALPFENNSFDAVTVAFGVRNFENLELGLREMLRVLKPQGSLCILEFSKPSATPFKQLFNFYFENICPRLGRWIAKDQSAYYYLYHSVNEFPHGNDFITILKKTGFNHLQCIPLTFGISSIYTAQKP